MDLHAAASRVAPSSCRSAHGAVLLVGIVGCSAVFAGQPDTPNRVWIDTDPACDGSILHDPDDCWALHYLSGRDDIVIAGVSSVFGNTSRAMGDEKLEALAARFLPGIVDAGTPLVTGASSATDALGAETAAEAMARAWSRSPMTILALGPLCNVAALVATRTPEELSSLTIVAMGGQLPNEVFVPGDRPFVRLGDLNVRADIAAVETVLRSGASVTFVSFSAAYAVRIDARFLDAFTARAGTAARLSALSRRWLSLWTILFGADGFIPFDLVASAYLLHPDEFRCQPVAARAARRRALFLRTRDTLEFDVESAGTGSPDAHLIRACLEVSPRLEGMLQAELLADDRPDSGG